jgi:dihydrofolate reductase
MRILMVAAQARNRVIGQRNGIPWKVKGEQKIFREVTMGKPMVIGRKTYISIGRPLPGRETIIITRDPDYSEAGCHIAGSLRAAIEAAAKHGDECVIAGGGDVYRQALPMTHTLYLTTIDATVEGDVCFPELPDHFQLEQETSFLSNLDYTLRVYQNPHPESL